MIHWFFFVIKSFLYENLILKKIVIGGLLVIKLFENSRIFIFNKPKPFILNCKNTMLEKKKVLPEQNLQLKAIFKWISNKNYVNTGKALPKFFYVFACQILHLNSFNRNTWLSVQERNSFRMLFNGRDSLAFRYKYLFRSDYNVQGYLSEALFIAINYNDTSFFKHILKKLFKEVSFFKHRNLIYYLRSALNGLNDDLNVLPNVNGVFIKFRGKIAQAGNSRRRSFLIGFGEISTSHSSRYLIDKFQIKTFTGCIGCTIIVSLKR